MRAVYLFAATVAMSLGSGGAYAADAASPNWGGFYVGVNAGAGWPSNRQSTHTYDPQGSLVDPSGLSQIVLFPASLGTSRAVAEFGAQAGYNYQVGKYVIGVEGDFSGLGKSGAATYSAKFYDASKAPYPSYYSTVHGKTERNGLATLRLRGGRDVGGVLLYATGGLALANVKASSSFADNNVNNPPPDYLSGSQRNEKVGYSVGGGAEFHLTQKISMKVEYIYYDLGTMKYNTMPNAFTAGDIPGVYQNAKYVADGNLLRVGLNYRF